MQVLHRENYSDDGFTSSEDHGNDTADDHKYSDDDPVDDFLSFMCLSLWYMLFISNIHMLLMLSISNTISNEKTIPKMETEKKKLFFDC